MNACPTFIEPLIFPLVGAFNAAGFETYASCEGHSIWRGNAELPYAAFRTSFPSRAKELAQWLRTDSESTAPVLRFAWSINPGFDASFDISYRLTCLGSYSVFSRFWPSHLRNDFNVISEHLSAWSDGTENPELKKLT